MSAFSVGALMGKLDIKAGKTRPTLSDVDEAVARIMRTYQEAENSMGDMRLTKLIRLQGELEDAIEQTKSYREYLLGKKFGIAHGTRKRKRGRGRK